MHTIRRLSAADTAAFQQLNELFGDVFDDASNYHFHQPSEDYLHQFLSDQNHIVLVAEDANAIVGGLVAYCLPKFEQERKEVFVYDIAVATTHQRHGVGKGLMDEIQSVAKAMGAYVVFVQADEGDAAVAFYEALQPTENLKTRNFDFNV